MSIARRVKADMHVHTQWSWDSRATVRELAHRIREVGLDLVCVTDHDTIEGALRLRENAEGFQVVVGEEIESRDGQILALFLQCRVPPGLPAEETIRAIRNQGGIVSIPHPFRLNRLYRQRVGALDRIRDLIDAVEVFNAREVSNWANRRAAAFAAKLAIPGTVGSDSHRASEIGSGWMEMDEFRGREDFVAALKTGVPHGGLMNSLFHLRSWYDTVRTRARVKGVG